MSSKTSNCLNILRETARLIEGANILAGLKLIDDASICTDDDDDDDEEEEQEEDCHFIDNDIEEKIDIEKALLLRAEFRQQELLKQEVERMLELECHFLLQQPAIKEQYVGYKRLCQFDDDRFVTVRNGRLVFVTQ